MIDRMRTLARYLLPPGLKRHLRGVHRRRVFRRVIGRIRRDPGRILDIGTGDIPDLIYGWGNAGWSAQGEYIQACVRSALEADGPVLECGSGLTTILLGIIAEKTGNRVMTLENDVEWGERVRSALEEFGLSSVEVATAPLKDYGGYSWYERPADPGHGRFSLVICDGPPGDTPGGRYGLMPVMGALLGKGAVILLDDAGRDQEQEIVRRWAAEYGVSSEKRGDEKPYFRIVMPVEAQ